MLKLLIRLLLLLLFGSKEVRINIDDDDDDDALVVVEEIIAGSTQKAALQLLIYGALDCKQWGGIAIWGLYALCLFNSIHLQGHI